MNPRSQPSPAETSNYSSQTTCRVGFSVVSKVSQTTLNASQSGNTLTFTRTGAFKLQAQINSLSTGLTGTWFDYPGGGSSPVNTTINPANDSVFYRLINQ